MDPNETQYVQIVTIQSTHDLKTQKFHTQKQTLSASTCTYRF